MCKRKAISTPSSSSRFSCGLDGISRLAENQRLLDSAEGRASSCHVWRAYVHFLLKNLYATAKRPMRPCRRERFVPLVCLLSVSVVGKLKQSCKGTKVTHWSQKHSEFKTRFSRKTQSKSVQSTCHHSASHAAALELFTMVHKNIKSHLPTRFLKADAGTWLTRAGNSIYITPF